MLAAVSFKIASSSLSFSRRVKCRQLTVTP